MFKTLFTTSTFTMRWHFPNCAANIFIWGTFELKSSLGYYLRRLAAMGLLLTQDLYFKWMWERNLMGRGKEVKLKSFGFWLVSNYFLRSKFLFTFSYFWWQEIEKLCLIFRVTKGYHLKRMNNPMGSRSATTEPKGHKVGSLETGGT